MSWKEILKQGRFEDSSIGEAHYLKPVGDGTWKVEQSIAGADGDTYSEDMINHALKMIGSDWNKANSISEHHTALEIYLNKANIRYYSNKQKRNILLDFAKKNGGAYTGERM